MTDKVEFTSVPFEDQLKMSLDEYTAYIASAIEYTSSIALKAKDSKSNEEALPVSFAVLNKDNGKTRVDLMGFLDGGISLATGSIDKFGVRVPAYALGAEAWISREDYVKDYVPSTLSARGHELGEGRPDLVGRDLLVFNEYFCLHLYNIDECQLALRQRLEGERDIVIFFGLATVCRKIGPDTLSAYESAESNVDAEIHDANPGSSAA